MRKPVQYYKECYYEYKCPWGVKPRVGMHDPALNLYATDCILYTKCPRKTWTANEWLKHTRRQSDGS